MSLNARNRRIVISTLMFLFLSYSTSNLCAQTAIRSRLQTQSSTSHIIQTPRRSFRGHITCLVIARPTAPHSRSLERRIQLRPNSAPHVEIPFAIRDSAHSTHRFKLIVNRSSSLIEANVEVRISEGTRIADYGFGATSMIGHLSAEDRDQQVDSTEFYNLLQATLQTQAHELILSVQCTMNRRPNSPRFTMPGSTVPEGEDPSEVIPNQSQPVQPPQPVPTNQPVNPDHPPSAIGFPGGPRDLDAAVPETPDSGAPEVPQNPSDASSTLDGE